MQGLFSRSQKLLLNERFKIKNLFPSAFSIAVTFWNGLALRCSVQVFWMKFPLEAWRSRVNKASRYENDGLLGPICYCKIYSIRRTLGTFTLWPFPWPQTDFELNQTFKNISWIYANWTHCTSNAAAIFYHQEVSSKSFLYVGHFAFNAFRWLVAIEAKLSRSLYTITNSNLFLILLAIFFIVSCSRSWGKFTQKLLS